ncbi:hypothetical protein [Tunturiibacter gelidiferens]|uniref:Uncharacterized protein n=1 Tax=Tunturiibacter gelidiferens TaxID=3069689 RepID=A0AAU7YZR2_9BACT
MLRHLELGTNLGAVLAATLLPSVVATIQSGTVGTLLSALTNGDNYIVDVFLGDGDGSFAPASRIITGLANSFGMAVGDLKKRILRRSVEEFRVPFSIALVLAKSLCL